MIWIMNWLMIRNYLATSGDVRRLLGLYEDAFVVSVLILLIWVWVGGLPSTSCFDFDVHICSPGPGTRILTIPEHPSRTIPSNWSLIWTWYISPPWTERSWGRWCGAACVMHLVIAVAGWKVCQLGPGLTYFDIHFSSGCWVKIRDHEMLDYQLILFVFVVRLVSVNFGAAFRQNLTFLVPCAVCDTRSTRPGVKWNWDPSTTLCPVEFQSRQRRDGEFSTWCDMILRFLGLDYFGLGVICWQFGCSFGFCGKI